MITRSKLVEQLFRDYQIRSQQRKCPILSFFSPKPFLSTWTDVAVASLIALLFGILTISSYLTLYYRHFWYSLLIISSAVLLAVRLQMSRWAFARKKEKRMLLPLSL